MFELDLESGALRKGGVLVKLRQQPYTVLATLAARPGRVVSRDELRSLVWGHDTFVDFDQGLNYCIKEIRAALGDSAETPLYVETLPRRGYRFLAPVDGPASTRAEPPPLPRVAPSPPVEPARAKRTWGRWLGRAHALVTVAALLLLTWLFTHRTSSPAEWERVTFRRGTLTGARFAPGGEIVYSAAWDGQPAALFASLPGSAEARTLPLAGLRVVGVTDQGEIAYLQERPGAAPVLMRASRLGGSEKPILEDVVDADVSRDGARFAVAHFVVGRGMLIEYPIGRVLTPVNAPSDLRIAPDGKHLAFVEHPSAEDDRGLVIVLDDSGRRVARTTYFSGVEGLAWSAESDEVLFTAGQHGATAALRGLDLGGRQRAILPGSGRLVIRDVDAAGRVLIERKIVKGEINLLAADGSQRDLSWFDASRGIALSADGSRLLFDEVGDAGGPAHAVYLRPTSGAPPVRLGTGVATALSPDGRYALAVSVEAPYQIDMLPIGAGVPRALRFPGIVQYQWAAFTPGGDEVVFVGGEDGRNMRVWSAVPDGKPRAITPEGLIITRDTLSPDGRQLTAPCRPARICLYSLDGSEPRPIPGIEGRAPVGWNPSGRALYVRPRRLGPTVLLEQLDLASGARVPWLEIAPRDPVGVMGLSRIVPGRDGRSVAFSYLRQLSELYVIDHLE